MPQIVRLLPQYEGPVAPKQRLSRLFIASVSVGNAVEAVCLLDLFACRPVERSPTGLLKSAWQD